MVTVAKRARAQHVPQYIGDLRMKIGYYTPWIPTSFADQTAEDGLYEMIKRDPEVSRCSHMLSVLAAGEGVTTISEDPRLCKLGDFAASQVEDFLHARKSLIEKGVLFGLGVQRKYYSWVQKWGMTWKVLSKLREVDRRRLRLERNPENKTDIYWTMWSLPLDEYIILEDRAINPNAAPGNAVNDYIWYIHQYEETSPYFEGFADILESIVYIKKNALQYWGDLAESWAKPFLVIMMDSMKAAAAAAIGSGLRTNAERAAQYMDKFETARARHMAVIDKNDELKYHERGGTGSNIIRELIEYCDKTITLLFIGTELTTTSGGGGSFAQATVQESKSDAMFKYNTLRAEELLTKEILFDFYSNNRDNIKRLGIPIPCKGDASFKFHFGGRKSDDIYGGRSVVNTEDRAK